MQSKVRHRFSTISRESLWWRSNITREDLTWVAKHLGHFLDGIAAFDVLPLSCLLANGPMDRCWDKRVAYFKGETAPHVHIPLGERYDYRREYEKAKRAGDPYLSPHGLFRKLEQGFHIHALQFMQQFGALTWKSHNLTASSAEWVNLSDFWARHARFVGVSKLWESRSDEESLKGAWRWIYERLDQINLVGPSSFGFVPLWEVHSYSPPPVGLPWELGGEFEAAIDELADFGVLRGLSLEVVRNELNMQTEDCRQIWMMTPTENASEDVSFTPTRGFSSLWGAIWDLFGQDISNLRLGWRLCLECGRLFYPKDRRSMCCTSVHQALWSKRKWAREHRRTELLGRSLSSKNMSGTL